MSLSLAHRQTGCSPFTANQPLHFCCAERHAETHLASLLQSPFNTIVSDPRATEATPDNSQSSTNRSHPASWSFNAPEYNRDDEGGEGTLGKDGEGTLDKDGECTPNEGGEGIPDKGDNGQSVVGGRDVGGEDDHDAQNRASRPLPAGEAGRGLQARQNRPSEAAGVDNTRREAPARRTPQDDASQRQKDEVNNGRTERDVGSYADSERGSAPDRRSMPAQDRNDETNTSQRHSRGSRGRSGARSRSRKAEGRNDGRNGAERASVPPSLYHGPRSGSPGSSHGDQAEPRKPSASCERVGQGQRRGTSKECRRHRRASAHSSDHSRGRVTDEERAEGSQAGPEPNPRSLESASAPRSRRPRRSDEARSNESRCRRAYKWVLPVRVTPVQTKAPQAGRNLWGMLGRGLIPPWKIIAMFLAMAATVCATAVVAWGSSGAFGQLVVRPGS